MDPAAEPKLFAVVAVSIAAACSPAARGGAPFEPAPSTSDSVGAPSPLSSAEGSATVLVSQPKQHRTRVTVLVGDVADRDTVAKMTEGRFLDCFEAGDGRRGTNGGVDLILNATIGENGEARGARAIYDNGLSPAVIECCVGVVTGTMFRRRDGASPTFSIALTFEAERGTAP